MKLNKKIFTALAVSSVAILGVTIVIASYNDRTNILSTKAENDVISSAITFNADSRELDGTTSYITGKTSKDSNVILKIENNDSTISDSDNKNYIGVLNSDTKFSFYYSDKTTEYTFEDIDKVSFTKDSTNFAVTWDITYDDGRTYTASTQANTNSSRNLSFASGSYGNISTLRFSSSTASKTKLSTIVLSYNCSPKSETGIEITAEPTKTIYSVGDVFDPSGMIVKINYSNGTSVATSGYTYSPMGELTVDDTEISISYMGMTTTQAISVSNENLNIANTKFTGSFQYTYYSDTTTYNLTFEFAESTGTYSVNAGSSKGDEAFSYVISGNSVIITRTGSENENLGRARLFNSSNSSATNTLSFSSITSGEMEFKVQLYYIFGSSYKDSTVATLTQTTSD